MFSFMHSYIPDPVVFSIGSFSLHWYGLLAAIGIASAWYIIERLQKTYNIVEDLFPLFSGAVISGLIGARLYHVVNELTFYIEHPFNIVRVWEGGLALHGGIIGAALYACWWVRKKQLSFGTVADIFATGGIVIQIFGRFGNYVNQELYGKITDLPWSIPIVANDGVTITYHHPTFLYEALLNTILFVVLLTLHRLKLHGKISISRGTIFLVYLLVYSFIRGSIELLRIDATPIIGGVRLPILISICIIVLVVARLFYKEVYEKISQN